MRANRRAWAVAGAVYLGSVAIALNQFKVPPAMHALQADLSLDMAAGAWLMSSLAVAGVVLAIPAAWLLRRVGPRAAGLFALGCTALGSVAGALARDAADLFIGRAVEGVGLAIISVIAPAVISLWFAPEQRGRPMGVWASWVPLGSFLMLNAAGPLLEVFGWRGVWWFGALAAAAAFILYAAVVGAPAPAARAANAAPASTGLTARLLLRAPSWVLALVFATFTFAFLSYSTWAPSYLSQALAMPPREASFAVSLSMLSIIPSTVLAGWVMDRLGSRHLVLSAALLAAAVLMLWSFRLSSPGIVAPYMLALGFVAGFIPAALFTLAPESMPRPELAGWALGILSVGQNAGMLLGPPVVAAAIANGSWAAGVVPLVAAITTGLAASVYVYRRRAERQPAKAAARPV
jgi:MFS family permease